VWGFGLSENPLRTPVLLPDRLELEIGEGGGGGGGLGFFVDGYSFASVECLVGGRVFTAGGW